MKLDKVQWDEITFGLLCVTIGISVVYAVFRMLIYLFELKVEYSIEFNDQFWLIDSVTTTKELIIRNKNETVIFDDWRNKTIKKRSKKSNF